MNITIGPESVSEEAQESIRLSFNPSGDATVMRIKLLACALMTEYQKIRDSHMPSAAREAAVAITNLQTASMWGVLAATKGLK